MVRGAERDGAPNRPITGRCYCGAATVAAPVRPLVTTYCHCGDCRRVTGAPVAAFSAFRERQLSVEGDTVRRFRAGAGVMREFCGACGTQLSARFDYLPGQVYVPLGILDQADEMPPTVHAHFGSRLPWLDIVDDAERVTSSSRELLNGADGNDGSAAQPELETCG